MKRAFDKSLLSRYGMKVRFIFIILLLVLRAPLTSAEETELGDKEIIHLIHDQPMYFLIGPPETKVQFSFRAKVIQHSRLYIAYTQKIFWDLFQRSSPIRDINYNPSIFYRFHLNDDSETIFDIIAYEHESNGKGGGDSRSWNRTGIRYQTAHHFESGRRGELSVRAWVPYLEDIPNPDLPEYRGIYEVTLTLSDFLGKSFDLNDVSFRFYPGGKSWVNPFQGGRELTFRLKGTNAAFLTNAVFQVFQGYGENMLEYKTSVWGFRAGIGI